MANQLDGNELIKQGNTRTWYQPGGAGSKPLFFGLDTQYHFVDGANIPTNGSIDPIYMPDPRRANRYTLVGRQVGAPSLPTATIRFSEKWGGIPRVLMAPKCEFNLIEVHSRCADFSDLYRGWDSYGLIYSGMKFTDDIDLGTRTAPDSDEMLMDTVSATGVSIYPFGAMSFGEEASADVVVEVVDVVYGTDTQCGDCGTANDGSKFIYALTRANVGSPAAPGQLVYSLNGGESWSTSSITGIGNTDEPQLIDIAGNVLFVCAGTNLFYTVLNQDTGAPTTWSSVAVGASFIDVYVQSPNSIWFITSAGIYKTYDVTIVPTLVDSGAPGNLHRIHGVNSTIVATGAAGTVRYTTNGVSWITATAPASTILHAVAIVDDRLWYVGGNNGNVYLSKDRGSSWSTVSIPNAGTGSVRDIIAPTREIIWIAHNINSVAYLTTTIDGGYTWTTSSAGTSRIVNFPTFQGISRIAAPMYADSAIAANYLTIGGLATGGADGVLIAGAPMSIW